MGCKQGGVHTHTHTHTHTHSDKPKLENLTYQLLGKLDCDRLIILMPATQHIPLSPSQADHTKDELKPAKRNKVRLRSVRVFHTTRTDFDNNKWISLELK